MKTAYQWIMFAALAAILIIQVVQMQINDTQIDINQKLIARVEALDAENAGQWKRISELEVMLCNPELIKCGK